MMTTSKKVTQMKKETFHVQIFNGKKTSTEVLYFRHDTFPLPDFNHVNRAHDIGVESILHVLSAALLLQGASGLDACAVNQQVEILHLHQRAHLLGALFYAVKVISV